MQRGGSNKNPHFRLVVTERASRRDGRYVELLGSYAPRDTVAARHLNLNLERVDYWLKIGAKPSDTARTLITKARKMAGEKVA